MKKTNLTAEHLAHKFKFKISNSAQIKKFRVITAPAIYRAGLELNGIHIVKKQQSNVIAWGTKEALWLQSIGGVAAEAAVTKVLEGRPPLIFLSSGFKTQWNEEIIKHCTAFQIPVASLDISVTEMNTTIGIYLLSHFVETASVHGSLVIVNGVGVLILGESGIGKSEAVLELIQNNHAFVSDDTVMLKRIGDELIGYPAEVTKNLLEARGVGLINVQYIYGARLVKNRAKVELAIELSDSKATYTFDRLGDQKHLFHILGIDIPKVYLPVQGGRTVSSLIEAATNVYLARGEGIDPIKLINERSRKQGTE